MKTKSSYSLIKKRYPGWQLPEFSVQEFFSKKNNYCICVFVINEGEKVQKQLKKMKSYNGMIDIIIADGGSTDGSLQESFLKHAGVRSILTKTGKGKLSAQMRMAFAYALDQGYDGVVVVDGNGKDDISAIPNFIRLLDEGYDHIQGSRFISGGKAINTPLSRLVAVKLIHAPLLSLASKHRHTDTTNGFRAYSKKLLIDPKIKIFRDIFSTYELHYHLSVESARRGHKLIETPVTRAYPQKGKTPTKISPVKGNMRVMMILLSTVLGKYRKD